MAATLLFFGGYPSAVIQVEQKGRGKEVDKLRLTPPSEES
jgi:hypothetical protein